MKVKSAKLFAMFIYIALLLMQGVLCFLVTSGIIDGNSGPTKNPAFANFNLQLLGLIPAIFSLVYFFVLDTDKRIKDGVDTIKLRTKLHETLNLENIARVEVVNSWASAWGFASTGIILGMLAIITNGISKERFLISYFVGLILMLIMYPRLDRLKKPFGDVNTNREKTEENKLSA